MDVKYYDTYILFLAFFDASLNLNLFEPIKY